MLEIYLLGTPKVILNGEDITHTLSQKSIGILAILLVHENFSVSREKLLGLLWPESPADAAKTNLRYNFWSMNKNIPMDPEAGAFLIVTREHCQVNRKYPFFCDMVELGRSQIELLDLVQAAKLQKLLQGDYLENLYFPGCETFVERIILQRQIVENKKATLLKKMVADCDHQPEHLSRDEYFQLLCQCEELDPYDETVALRRIEYLKAAGDAKGALNYYHYFSSRLMGDLGVHVSDALRESVANLKRGDTAPTKETRPSETTEFSFAVRGIPEIPGYGIGLILKELLDAGIKPGDFLPKEAVQELAYFQYRLGDPGHSNLVRATEVFVEFIQAMGEKGYGFRVRTSHMDSVSENIWKACLQGSERFV